jgi:hypothetical protein
MISPGWRALTFVFTTIASFVITFLMGVLLTLGFAPYAPDSIFFLFPAFVAAICSVVWAWLILPFILRSHKAEKNFREQSR